MSSIPNGGNFFLLKPFKTPQCQFCTIMLEITVLCYLWKPRVIFFTKWFEDNNDTFVLSITNMRPYFFIIAQSSFSQYAFLSVYLTEHREEQNKFHQKYPQWGLNPQPLYHHSTNWAKSLFCCLCESLRQKSCSTDSRNNQSHCEVVHETKLTSEICCTVGRALEWWFRQRSWVQS